MTPIVQEFITNYDKYKRIAHKITKNPSAADDVMQNTYLVLIRRGDLSTITNLKAYIRQTLYNVFCDSLRSRVFKDFIEIDEIPLVAEFDMEANLDSQRISKRVKEFVQGLPTVQKEIMNYILYSGTAMDCAKNLNKRPNTVRVNYRHAKLRLKEAFTKKSKAVLLKEFNDMKRRYT